MAFQGGTLGNGVRAFYSTGLTYPYTWTEITELMESVVPAVERDEVDTTRHGNAGLMTSIPGLGKVRDGELTVLADLSNSSEHVALRVLNDSQDTIRMRYEIPEDADLSTTLFLVTEMDARVKSWVVDTPVNGAKTLKTTQSFVDNFFQYATLQHSAR